MLDEGEDHPPGDPVVGTFDPGRGEFLIDQKLFDRPRRTSPRRGPVRHDVAGRDELIELGLGVQLGNPLGLGADLTAQRLGLRRQIQAVGPGDAPPGQIEDIGGGSVAAEDPVDGQRTTQVQVRVVLPGEPDTAVHLNVEFGVAEVGREGQRRRGRRGQLELRLTVPGGLLGRAGGVPDTRQRRLRGHQHVGAMVLDRLKRGDGAAELLADLGVLDGGLDTVRGPAHGLGGEEGASARQGCLPRPGQQVAADHDVGESDPAGPPGPVETAGQLYRDTPGAALDQQHVLADRQ